MGAITSSPTSRRSVELLIDALELLHRAGSSNAAGEVEQDFLGAVRNALRCAHCQAPAAGLDDLADAISEHCQAMTAELVELVEVDVGVWEPAMLRRVA